VGWAGSVLRGPVPATYLDRNRASALRYGRKPRGPELMSVAQSNRPQSSRGRDLVNAFRTILTRVIGFREETPPSARQRQSLRLDHESGIAPGAAKIATVAAGTDNAPQARWQAAGTHADRASAESGPRVRTRREATRETLLRVEAHAYHFQAAQCRSSSCVPPGGVQQRTRKLLQRRRADTRRVAWETAEKWGLHGGVQEEQFRRLSDGQIPLPENSWFRYQTARE